MPGPAASPQLRARVRTSGSRFARRMLDQPLRRVGVIGAVLLLAGTAAFGGLEPETADALEDLPADTPVDVAPFEVTLEHVRWLDDVPGAYLDDEGDRWVAVVAVVRNTSDASVLSPFLRDAITLEGFDGARTVDEALGVRSSTALLLEDGSVLNPIQPGLEYEVALLFEQDGSVPPPREVTVRLQRHTWRAGSLDRTLDWWEPTTAAVSTLPVTEAPGGDG